MKNNIPIKIAIIDDQKLIIDGLISLLNQSEEITVVGFSTDGLETKSLLKKTEPEIVLMDYRFPNLKQDGIEIAQEALMDFPNIKFLMLTSYDEFALVKDALKKGIKGYLLKNTGTEELIHAIKLVASGQSYLGSNIQQKIINTWANEDRSSFSNPTPSSNPKQSIVHPLTKRELEIARLYSAGKSRKEIAENLFISTNTVDTHLKNTFGKLGVKNVAELINHLIKRNLIS